MERYAGYKFSPMTAPRGHRASSSISRYTAIVWSRISFIMQRAWRLPCLSVFTMLLLAATTAQASIGTDTIFSDDFNRSNGAVGASYSVSGTLAISGNKVYGDGVAVLASTGNFANANYKVEVDTYASASYNGTYPQGVGDGIELFARRTAADTYYVARVWPDDTGTIMRIVLNKVVGGTSTQLGLVPMAILTVGWISSDCLLTAQPSVSGQRERWMIWTTISTRPFHISKSFL